MREISGHARLLKLDGKEEGGGDIDPFHLDAGRVRAAGRDLVHPEVKAGCVWLAVEKIEVMRAHEKRRVVDRVNDGCARVIVENGHLSMVWCSQAGAGAGRIAQGQIDGLVVFVKVVILDQDLEGLASCRERV